ncbi:MAG: hypothetical protein WCB12_02945 [Bryobacteraceae bacterium]
MSKRPAPAPKTLEEALTLFPGATVSARHLNGKWSFLIDSGPRFIYTETRWRPTWQAVFKTIWRAYRTQVDQRDVGRL